MTLLQPFKVQGEKWAKKFFSVLEKKISDAYLSISFNFWQCLFWHSYTLFLIALGDKNGTGVRRSFLHKCMQALYTIITATFKFINWTYIKTTRILRETMILEWLMKWDKLWLYTIISQTPVSDNPFRKYLVSDFLLLVLI